MAELQVEIVAADHFVWSGAAKLVKARSVDGEIGVLPGHVPMLSVLAAGDLEIDPVSEARFSVQIDGGFCSVDSDRVVIVADNAVIGTAA
ncbi:ATP synthase F1 subunit epsilon [Arthrobacter sp. MYb211]|uniref:F0F1 ATP synthase subunit epsilon n=1 Tax=Micrococcaceae TaxID=1268 RepID=UPI000BB716F7|nr:MULTISPECIES: F0F1 ATP synthase subunit epsilon [Micrococcaceae]PCC29661.1 ATP synthase F1 subunit epsilon [Glutamicibacter sp. BW80]PQZ97112.1 ATP synthase F1 subunit epsilon [Arthrobacter sp. MYb224]PRA00026.1 ATP synthase F1 subunit epsilon [Arthrobacter sp. MYb229]PRA08409.1 ATP synthase F1 subunit epsilon [Arthrobacter sp. MYb221]PRB48300.1 ATP synthase F1 subunit epsilon [Arthrobacter sp. MYb216]